MLGRIPKKSSACECRSACAHTQIFWDDMAIAQALPSDISLWTRSGGAKGHLTGSLTFRHILWQVLPLHSCGWGAHTLSSGKQAALAENSMPVPQTLAGWGTMTWSTLFALACLLSPAPSNLAQGNPQPGHTQHPTPAIPWGCCDSGNQDFGWLCPGLTHKLVLTWNGTANTGGNVTPLASPTGFLADDKPLKFKLHWI